MFDDLKNTIDFFICSKTKFSRKNFVEKNPKILSQIERENLYLKDILEKTFEKKNLEFANILDIGSKNWYYAKAQYNFFKSFCNDFLLTGVELDAYRLYSNFYSRFEVAKYYTKGLEKTKYLAKNLLEINQKQDYIIWILPFVSINPLRFWGLPEKFFMTEKLLTHAFNLLKDNGQMLIINQGEKEKDLQRQLLEKLNISFVFLGEIESEYYKYQNKRFGFLIKK